ncbi:DUF6527 family protein [Frondihabitans sp. PhB188]|uniref:DUF6527 family protein n=1 Tax=Frondihabitans sp. PhB188 TaxID=2485200 RepID=UPI00351A0605
MNDTLAPKTAVLVQAGGNAKWLVFDCPCSGHHRVMVNLNPETRPLWKIDQSNPLSLRPSVDERSPGRHCHYVVHDGRIRWVERTEPRT